VALDAQAPCGVPRQEVLVSRPVLAVAAQAIDRLLRPGVKRLRAHRMAGVRREVMAPDANLAPSCSRGSGTRLSVRLVAYEAAPFSLGGVGVRGSVDLLLLLRMAGRAERVVSSDEQARTGRSMRAMAGSAGPVPAESAVGLSLQDVLLDARMAAEADGSLAIAQLQGAAFVAIPAHPLLVGFVDAPARHGGPEVAVRIVAAQAVGPVYVESMVP
jgi:hypothetical protein